MEKNQTTDKKIQTNARLSPETKSKIAEIVDTWRLRSEAGAIELAIDFFHKHSQAEYVKYLEEKMREAKKGLGKSMDAEVDLAAFAVQRDRSIESRLHQFGDNPDTRTIESAQTVISRPDFDNL